MKKKLILKRQNKNKYNGKQTYNGQEEETKKGIRNN